MPPQNQQPNQPATPYPTQPSTVPIVQSKKEGPPKILIIAPIVILTLLFIGALIFGFWAYGERNDYRDNVQSKVGEAVETANEELREDLESEFLEREKSPFRIYNGPGEFGSVRISYPKTWSAAVDERGSGGTPVEGVFHPNVVPGERSDTAVALKFEVIEQSYDRVLRSYESDARRGRVRISPYNAPEMPGILGARIDGEIERNFQGSAVVFPLRDKTLRFSTLSPQFVPDFNNIILANLEFTP